jgi:Protein of unknown function (DUF3363)
LTPAPFAFSVPATVTDTSLAGCSAPKPNWTRQRNTMLVEMSWRRQTTATLTPGASDSMTIATFCSSVKPRLFDRRVLSPTGLAQQIGHEGATWLDRELAARERTILVDEGFGRAVKVALERRKRSLVEMGHATDLDDARIRAPKDLIRRLEAADIDRAGRALAVERGREWQPAVPGNHVSGRLVGSTQLSSGRFAMIDDGLGFSLVPWRPALAQHVGRQISGVAMPGGDVDWSFGRKRGLGL